MYAEIFTCDNCGCQRNALVRADWFILTLPPPALPPNSTREEVLMAKADPVKHLCSVRCLTTFVFKTAVDRLTR